MNRKALIILLSVSWLVLLILFLALMSVYRFSGHTKIALSGKKGFFSSSEVGVLEIKGVIMDSDDILEKIRDLKEKDSVKAVIVRVDSPGGGISASQEIYEELKKLDKEKPVIASLSSVASRVPKAASASALVTLRALSSAASECTTRMPRPPPPADALMITG